MYSLIKLMDNNTSKAIQPFFYSLFLAIGFLAGTFSFSNKEYQKISDVINVINRDYVDTVNTNKLTELAINGILQGLDPHSYYISANDYAEANDFLQGEFEGIGIQFHIINDTVTVINTISGGPSEKIGILPGDRIIKIENQVVAGVKIKEKEILSKLKGPKGTKVNVSVFRRGSKNLLDFTITRDVIPTYSVDAAYMIVPEIAYIKLGKFSATTHSEMVKELKQLQTLGMKKLILDLRGNGGGYMEAAVDIVNELMPQNKTIVFTKGKNRKTQYFVTTGNGLFQYGDLVVLIDELSASASEIVAGAIQDNDRGLIIGRRSFGKGLVQSQFQFKDGSAIRLTVARYYTPSGRCIQRPYKNGIENYYSDFYSSLFNDKEENLDSLNINDSLKYKTVKGRTVYGGGGIMPDIVVIPEKDSSLYWYNEISNLGLAYRFAFDLTDKNRKQLSSIHNVEEFDKTFNITDKLYDDFVNFAVKNGAKLSHLDNNISKNRICELIKAYVARNIIGDKGFYPILNRNDKVILKALEVLKNNNNPL